LDEDGIRSYRDLAVWKLAMDLAEGCYRVTKEFPRDEMYGMTAQIRRSAASVAANVAEGHGRESTGAFVQFLRVAQGSLKELETHLLLADRVGLGTSQDTSALLRKADDLGKMLRSLIRSLQRRMEGQ
jgi:four helix bundle protein